LNESIKILGFTEPSYRFITVSSLNAIAVYQKAGFHIMSYIEVSPEDDKEKTYRWPLMERWSLSEDMGLPRLDVRRD